MHIGCIPQKISEKNEGVWNQSHHFYGTEIKIWVGFGPVGNTEKKNWANYELLLRAFFSCFQNKKILLFF